MSMRGRRLPRIKLKTTHFDPDDIYNGAGDGYTRHAPAITQGREGAGIN